MNHLLRLTVFFALAGLFACTDKTGEAESQEQEPESYVFTHYTDATELFVEFSALIVGETSSFAAHFSKMSDFRPVETGTVIVTLTGGGHPEERFSIDKAAVAGIFIPQAKPKYAGQRQLTLELSAETMKAKHDLGEINVYPDMKTALAAVSEEVDDSGEISFLKEQQWKVDFATEVLQMRDLQYSVRAFGSIKAAAGNESIVSAPISGHLLTQASVFPQVGTTVTKGQVLASLAARLSGSSDLAELELSVQKALAQYQLANTELKRLQKLFKGQAVAERRVISAQSNAKIAKAELNAARKRLKQIRNQNLGSDSGVNLYAPIDGVLASVNVTSGSYVEEGDALFHIIDANRLWLETRIAEADSTLLETPERVGFKIAGLNKGFQIRLEKTGKLISYGQIIDPVSRTLSVVFEFDNKKYQLPVGLLARARIYSGEKIKALAVPETALVDDNGQDVVFVHTSGESFQRRVLRLGLRDSGYIQVLSGLKPGERVVTTGAYLVHLASLSTQPAAHGHGH